MSSHDIPVRYYLVHDSITIVISLQEAPPRNKNLEFIIFNTEAYHIIPSVSWRLSPHAQYTTHSNYIVGRTHRVWEGRKTNQLQTKKLQLKWMTVRLYTNRILALIACKEYRWYKIILWYSAHCYQANLIDRVHEKRLHSIGSCDSLYFIHCNSVFVGLNLVEIPSRGWRSLHMIEYQ